MHLWVHPEFDTQEEKALIAKWNSLLPASSKEEEEIVHYNYTGPDKSTGNAISHSIESSTAEAFNFDPNTLDSAGFRKLGLKEKTTSILLHWRAKGKRFYKKEDLKPLYTLSEEEYHRLAPYIVIGPVAKVSLNRADSQTLVGLKGIGPKLAHRILERRHTQGAFTSFSQLMELYQFPDSTFGELQQRLTLD